MKEHFVIVYTQDDETCFATRSSLQGATDGAIDTASENGVVVQRVFSFNEYGHVTHYKMELERFTPVLKPVPSEVQSR